MKSLPPEELAKQRKRFEAAYSKRHPCRHFCVNQAGQYTDFETANAWAMWLIAISGEQEIPK